MSKFNTVKTRPAVRSPIVTDTRPAGLTHEGAPGYARDAKGELFLLAVANMVGERTFYEDAAARDGRYERLVAKVAVEDPQWIAGFLRWLRIDGNMRSASLVGALEEHIRRARREHADLFKYWEDWTPGYPSYGMPIDVENLTREAERQSAGEQAPRRA